MIRMQGKLEQRSSTKLRDWRNQEYSDIVGDWASDVGAEERGNVFVMDSISPPPQVGKLSS